MEIILITLFESHFLNEAYSTHLIARIFFFLLPAHQCFIFYTMLITLEDNWYLHFDHVIAGLSPQEECKLTEDQNLFCFIH